MLNKDGAFLVKGSGENTKFCTTCCGGGGGGEYVWDCTATLLENKDAPADPNAYCLHSTGGIETRFTMRTDSTEQAAVTAALKRAVTGAWLHTGKCYGYVNPAASGCVSPSAEECAQRGEAPGCWPTLDSCCNGRRLFVNGEWTQEEFDGSFMKGNFKLNDCSKKINSIWTYQLILTAAMREPQPDNGQGG